MKAPQRERSLNPAIPLLWLGLAVWGTLAMMSEANKPGQAGAPPAKWPSQSSIANASKRPALIMFVNPHCSCSTASIGELSLLLDECKGRVNAHVFFFEPSGGATNASQSDLWRQAEAIPGLALAFDSEGREAKLFGAETSGQVVFYNADGRLRFQGGITASRGCLGTNAGWDSLEGLICRKSSLLTQTPVFGCPLFAGNLAARSSANPQ